MKLPAGGIEGALVFFGVAAMDQRTAIIADHVAEDESKSRDVVRFNGMNRRACQIPVDGLQVRLFAKNDIGGVFALVHAPVITGGEIAVDRAAKPRQLI